MLTTSRQQAGEFDRRIGLRRSQKSFFVKHSITSLLALVSCFQIPGQSGSQHQFVTDNHQSHSVASFATLQFRSCFYVLCTLFSNMQMHRFQMGSAAMMPWLGVERLSAPFHAHTFPHCFSPFCRVLHSFFFYVGVLALRSMVLLSHSHRHGHCKLCRRLCTCRCPPKAGPAGPAGPCCLCHL